MIYLLVFLFPFLGPFFRAQPFIGIFEVVIGLPFFAFLAFLTGGLTLIGWPVIGFQEMQKTWNYRRHGICIQDHL